MENKKYSIWIEAECWIEDEWDINNNNTDVIVEFEDNSKWIASFFTYSNIVSLVEKNKQTGECLSGKYFWSSEMIFVDEISRTRIEEVVKYLLEGNGFYHVFKKKD